MAIALQFAMVSANHAAEPVRMSSQVLTLRGNASPARFADVEGNGRCHLLILDPLEKKLANHRQGPAGFNPAPDQVVPLPPECAWAGVCDVDAHPGLELVFSTAAGVTYSRQNDGLFESDRYPLIEVPQVFPTECDLPTLNIFTNSAGPAGTNAFIPVMAQGRPVLYERNSAFEWRPGPALNHDAAIMLTKVTPWSAGTHPALGLCVEHSLRVEPDPNQHPELERRRIPDVPEIAAVPTLSGGARFDMDGDGQIDLALWRAQIKLDFKTDIYLFLRRPDGKLPERPTQVLHCAGFPLPDSMAARRASPFHDLNGDGRYELVLLKPTTVFTSTGNLIEMALSRGVDCSLTIRSLRRGEYTRRVDSSLTVRMLLLLESDSWPYCIQGDFNGDHRADLLIRRSNTLWHVFFSTSDGRWFADQPALAFEAPARGSFNVQDLNGDTLADIVWHDWDRGGMCIFLSPSRGTKVRNR